MAADMVPTTAVGGVILSSAAEAARTWVRLALSVTYTFPRGLLAEPQWLEPVRGARSLRFGRNPDFREGVSAETLAICGTESDHAVSGKHFVLERLGAQSFFDGVQSVQADGLSIADAGSTFGTFVNGVPIGAEPVSLNPGDIVGAGHHLLVATLRDESDGPNLAPMIGTGRAMRRARADIRRCAASAENVLVRGETGTGKEVVAQHLHELSGRAGKRPLATNCAALQKGLIGSELFGHVRGVFTNATSDKEGYFEAVGEGTLFLDEIGDLPLEQQAVLLRVVQERRFQRVGATKDTEFRGRLVTATHRNLAAMIQINEFREDLFHRLRVLSIRLPPLRHRREDIGALMRFFLEKEKAEALTVEQVRYGGANVRFEDVIALERLLCSVWTGNVRQLENSVKAACVLGGGRVTASGLLALVEAKAAEDAADAADAIADPPALIARDPVPHRGTPADPPEAAVAPRERIPIPESRVAAARALIRDDIDFKMAQLRRRVAREGRFVITKSAGFGEGEGSISALRDLAVYLYRVDRARKVAAGAPLSEVEAELEARKPTEGGVRDDPSARTYFRALCRQIAMRDAAAERFIEAQRDPARIEDLRIVLGSDSDEAIEKAGFAGETEPQQRLKDHVADCRSASTVRTSH